MKTLSSFLIIVESEYKKIFAIFVPHQFKNTTRKSTGNQLAFYWINDDELVTCINSKNPGFRSDSKEFIEIYGRLSI